MNYSEYCRDVPVRVDPAVGAILKIIDNYHY